MVSVPVQRYIYTRRYCDVKVESLPLPFEFLVRPETSTFSSFPRNRQRADHSRPPGARRQKPGARPILSPAALRASAPGIWSRHLRCISRAGGKDAQRLCQQLHRVGRHLRGATRPVLVGRRSHLEFQCASAHNLFMSNPTPLQ